jgi:REP element-mobilizing transposase RayT
LNGKGKIVNECWKGIPEHSLCVSLDEYVIMPNHFHGVIVINEIDINCWARLPRPYERRHWEILRHILNINPQN